LYHHRVHGPGTLPRLRAWLDRPEIIALDAPRIDALARALDDADPPVRVERWGTVVGYEAGPPRRRRVQCYVHGHLIAALQWNAYGSLRSARHHSADCSCVAVDPGVDEHPAWGASDRVWLLDGDEPWRPVEPLSVFRALDWAQLDHIPPLAEPRRLPPGAGSAVLNLLASLMKDQGLARVRYRGPFPSEQLFTSLLEAFRHDPTQALPLERFLADGGLDWLPAPFESHHVAPWVTVQLRQDIPSGRRRRHLLPAGLAGHQAARTAVIRDEGERVICSLWALVAPQDRLILDRSERFSTRRPSVLPRFHRAAAPCGTRRSAISSPAKRARPRPDDRASAPDTEPNGRRPRRSRAVWEKRIRLSARLAGGGGFAPERRARTGAASRPCASCSKWPGSSVRGARGAQAVLESLPGGAGATARGGGRESEALDESAGRLIAPSPAEARRLARG
jgi:hypothetical protein